MTAGILAESGYFMGEELLPATEANPKGYFESREVERINDELVRGMLEPTLVEKIFHRQLMTPAQVDFIQSNRWSRATWLVAVPARKRPRSTPQFAQDISRAIPSSAFCFKDPRFCYTLPAWRPHLPDDTVYICVFRSPVITALSMLKEIPKRKYLGGMEMSFEEAVQVWVQMYKHILTKHRRSGEWLFVHYSQILSGEGIDSMAEFISVDLDRSFPDTALTRTSSDIPIPESALSTYAELCDLARFDRAD